MFVLDDDWSYLPGPVIDNLITVLRRLNRWRKDGPSLRSLNQHWRERVDSCITQIRPIGTIFCGSVNLESLSKMFNLRHLRLDPFLASQSQGKSSKSQIMRLSCLSNLRRLTDLELRGRSSQSVRFCPSECFRNVTSVVFNDACFQEGQSVSLLGASPIRNLTFRGKSCCQYLKYPWLSTLRSLEFATDNVSTLFMERVTELVELTSLSIGSKNGELLDLRNAEKLSQLTSLNVLHLPDCELRYPVWITTLSSLETLSFKLYNYNEFEERIWSLLKSLRFLKALSLPHRLIDSQHFLEFYKSARNLKSLEFRLLPEETDEDLTTLTQLTQLIVCFDCQTSKFPAIFQLPLLQECFLKGLFIQEPFLYQNQTNLRNLVLLEIEWCLSDTTINQITHLQSLKKVCFYNCVHMSLDGVSELRNLPELKELCLSRVPGEKHLEGTAELQELFSNLELLCLSHSHFAIFDTPWLHTMLPHVKKTYYLVEFSSQSRIGTKSRRIL